MDIVCRFQFLHEVAFFSFRANAHQNDINHYFLVRTIDKKVGQTDSLDLFRLSAD